VQPTPTNHGWGDAHGIKQKRHRWLSHVIYLVSKIAAINKPECYSTGTTHKSTFFVNNSGEKNIDSFRHPESTASWAPFFPPKFYPEKSVFFSRQIFSPEKMCFSRQNFSRKKCFFFPRQNFKLM
jgi:hypothetical protein